MLLKLIMTMWGMLLCNSLYAFKVSICKVIEHDAINSVVSGIMDYLPKQGIKYKIETCQGNAGLAFQIGNKFINEKSDVIVAIGTTPAQCIFKYAKDNRTKLIFSSVTDPNCLGQSFESNNTSGVSNFVDLKPQLQLFRKIQPNLKKLGIIYNTSEANSVSIIKKLDSLCKELDIDLVKLGIQKSSDIPQAINKLKNEIDAIFISNDNTVLSGISYIIKVCNLAKKPVYVSDTDQVEKGCLAALGPNQYEVGRQTGAIIERIKNGEDINAIKVEYPKKTELFINLKVASFLKIDIPNDILLIANKVIGEK